MDIFQFVIGVLYPHVKIRKEILYGGRERVETTQRNRWKGVSV